MDPITVESINLFPQNNAKENYTEEYDLVNSPDSPAPVFRRGQNFSFEIRFNRTFDQQQDVVRISFSIGPNANVSKGTRVILPILAQQTQLPQINRWSLCFVRSEGNSVILQAHIPSSAQVGIWNCSVQSNISGQRDKRNDYKCDEDIYVVFNPWCKDDAVYMENEQDRKEYVLNENGKIWIGTFREPKGKRWVFGQFDDVVLPAAIFLLEKSKLPHSDRGSPILVARAISAVINANDDDGLLVGKWDGEYDDGTSPFAWTGSTAIMDQFLRTGGQSVKYGQCWVYSAATVTVCRTLGIPCRSVTNYVSAHDTNRSLTVDKYFDLFGNLIENGPQGDCHDSCWNFHVWNDVWMARPDLPAGYGGWQIIDGTPQELSGNIYCCGPASIEAVRKGEVGFLYDTPFVFSEVNADICHFQEDDESDWGFSRMSINRYHVGRKILTKQTDKNDDEGDSDMWDVTQMYKNPEGSDAERQAVINAIKGVPRAQEQYKIPAKTKEDVFFDLVDIDTVPFGQGFDVIVNIQNNSKEIRNISATLSASSIYYTGATVHRLKRSQGTFTVKPGEKELLKIRVQPSEYIGKLVDHSLIKIYALANVKETKQSWCEEDDFTLTKPVLKVQVGNASVGQDCTVNFSFKNPLNTTLTQCKYTIEGHGLQKPKSVDFKDIQSNDMVTFNETFVPRLAGNRTIVATFNSKQVDGIGGSASVLVN